MKSAAIFDMDGLMFDTERIYRDNWMLYAPRFGYKADPEFPKAVCGTRDPADVFGEGRAVCSGFEQPCVEN